jgi:NAD(P)H-dependent FMN reductase
MHVLGIVTSPRGENGLSHRLVSRVLWGARSAGAETTTLCLIDQEPEYCIHCGYACFDEGNCIQEEDATLRSRQVEAADALVIAAPVYCWQPNGLAAAFFDKTRLSTGSWNRDGQHGRSALGIAVAGGTGTGVFTALQSIYAWLCLWKFRPLDPVPVTRFNLDRALDGAVAYGRVLAQNAPQPFESTAELLCTYDGLPYMDYGRVDEFRWLAEQTAAGLEGKGKRDRAAEIWRLLAEGGVCAARDDKRGEAQRYVDAYQMGAQAWRDLT